MRITVHPYDDFMEARFGPMHLVRTVGGCSYWSGTGEEQFLLIAVEESKRRVAVFDYDTREDRERDIAVIHRIPADPPKPDEDSPRDEEGEGEAGVPSPRKPLPPVRSSGAEEPLPDVHL